MSLNIEDLKVSLQKKEILHGISLEIQEGEFVSLLGKSGCGKTTLLKCIAGLLEQESGDIRIQGASVMDQQPKNRGTVIVFQDLRLFPHMTAEKNIAFPMELKKVPKKERKERVEELLRAVQLPGFGKRRMREMSGGQMQRVALARALAAEPRVLLLDEPFSGLDEGLRTEMARLVRKLVRPNCADGGWADSSVRYSGADVLPSKNKKGGRVLWKGKLYFRGGDRRQICQSSV